jgi:hypothetical protein
MSPMARRRERSSNERRARWSRWLTLLVALLLPLGAPIAAESEYDVKAAFLYNFMKFVDWPPSSFQDPSTPVTLCIMGRDPFSPALEAQLTTKTIKERRVVVRHVDSIQQAQSCQVLFVSSSEAAGTPELLRSLHAKPVLTVGETAGFANQGGVIELSLDRDRVRFDVNAKAADTAGLKVSAKLMSVAKSSRPEPSNP